MIIHIIVLLSFILAVGYMGDKRREKENHHELKCFELTKDKNCFKN